MATVASILALRNFGCTFSSILVQLSHWLQARDSQTHQIYNFFLPGHLNWLIDIGMFLQIYNNNDLVTLQ